MCATHSPVHENEWDQLDLGIHVCSIYRNKDEQFSSLVPFFAKGFKRHEKCLYVFEENLPEEISALIHSTENDPSTENAPANLEILSSEETYTKDGSFDPDTMASLLKEKVADSLTQGYSGLRGTGEMSWVLASGTPIEKLIEYEQELNTFYPAHKITSVCQYNENEFPHEFLISAIRTHPYVIIYGKLYKNKYFYTDPEYADVSKNRFKSNDYETILSMITDDEPIT